MTTITIVKDHTPHTREVWGFYLLTHSGQLNFVFDHYEFQERQSKRHAWKAMEGKTWSRLGRFRREYDLEVPPDPGPEIVLVAFKRIIERIKYDGKDLYEFEKE